MAHRGARGLLWLARVSSYRAATRSLQKKTEDEMKNIPVLAGFQSSISSSISSAMPGFMSVISYSVASVCIMGRAVSLNK